jgi:hypothetical protein
MLYDIFLYMNSSSIEESNLQNSTVTKFTGFGDTGKSVY